MDKANQIIRNVKHGILEQIRDKLINCDGEEVYFHDIVSEEVDTNTPTNRQICLDLIDMGESSYFDEGLIDHSSLDRTLITMAYCSIEQILFNDDFIQYLQGKLNNEKINKEDAEEIIKRIDEEYQREGFKISKVVYEDNSTHIFIETSFSIGSLTKEDFTKYGLIDKQILDLSDIFKILTSNKTINQNAIVIEEKRRDIEKKKYLFRVYLMDKDKDIDIRNFFKLDCISAETGFNLSPSAYIEQSTEQYENDKLRNIKNYLHIFKDKTKFIKHIVKMASKLTERTI